MTETAVVRDQAEQLLKHLQLGRQLSERRLIETGEQDPMASITGRSAIDTAIAMTRAMIVNMDELLDGLHGERETAAPASMLVEAGSAP